jgi:hypothetical protein
MIPRLVQLHPTTHELFWGYTPLALVGTNGEKSLQQTGFLIDVIPTISLPTYHKIFLRITFYFVDVIDLLVSIKRRT